MGISNCLKFLVLSVTTLASIILIILLRKQYICGCFVCMYVCAAHACLLALETGRRHWIHRTGVTERWEPLCGCLDLNPSYQEVQYVSLTTKISLPTPKLQTLSPSSRTGICLFKSHLNTFLLEVVPFPLCIFIIWELQREGLSAFFLCTLLSPDYSEPLRIHKLVLPQ